MKLKIRSLITLTLLGLAIVLAAQQLHAEEPSQRDSESPNWIIVYTPKVIGDYSEGSVKAWANKQEYDYKLLRSGRILMAGVSRSGGGGSPKDWIVFLQPMNKAEAQKIMENDPSVQGGFATAEIKTFSKYIAMPSKQ